MNAEFLKDTDTSRTPTDTTLNSYVIEAMNGSDRVASSARLVPASNLLKDGQLESFPQLVPIEGSKTGPQEGSKVESPAARPLAGSDPYGRGPKSLAEGATEHKDKPKLDLSHIFHGSSVGAVLGSTAILGGAAQIKGGLGDLSFDYNLAKISLAANPKTLQALKWLSVPTAAASIYSFSKDEQALLHHVPHSGEAVAADLVTLTGAAMAFNSRTAPFSALVQMAGLGARVAIGKLDAVDGNQTGEAGKVVNQSIGT